MPSHPVRSALLPILVALVVVALPQVAPGAPLGTAGTLVLEPLTETADADETDPAWSSDGSTLLVTRRDEDGNALVAIDLERGAAAEVVRDAEAGDWSPDGRRIVFVRGGELWVVAASGGEAVRISEPDAEATFTDPAWSPDGSLIAATVTPDGSGPAGQEVGVLPATGGIVRLLTSSSDDDDATTWVSAHEAAWHPDGRSLIYTRRLGDGTALHRVALSDGADAALLPPPADDDPSTEAAAAPSPDVGWLAFWGDGSVWLVDPAAPALRRRLTLPEENLDEPAFSPDGSRLALSDGGDVWILGPAPAPAPQPPQPTPTPALPAAGGPPAAVPAPVATPASAAPEPLVVTGPVERRWGSRVTVTGTVDPRGAVAVYRFEYRPVDTAVWHAPVDARVPGTGPTRVTHELRLLPPGRYEYRLVARSGPSSTWTIGVQDTFELFSVRARAVLIDSGARFTRDPDVTLTVAAPPGASGVEVANRVGFAGVRRFPVGVPIRWRLEVDPRARGLATVRVRFVGGGLDPTMTSTATVVVDGVRPALLAVRASTNGRVPTRPGTFRAVRLAFSVRDAGSGVSGVQITADRRRPGRVWSYRAERIQRTRADRLWVRVVDRAGNTSPWRGVRLRR